MRKKTKGDQMKDLEEYSGKYAPDIKYQDFSKDALARLLNAYSKANEAGVTFHCHKLLKKQGGDIVLICNFPDGQICHYTARSFGKERGCRLWGPRKTLPARVKRMLTVGSGIDRAGLDWIGPDDAVTRVKGWPKALDILKRWHGDTAKVGVVPDGTIQYFPDHL